MAKSRTLSELATEIMRQSESKRDFVAPTSKLRMELQESDNERWTPKLGLDNGNGGLQFGVTELAHGQLADRLAIPQRYYERMRAEAPSLLAGNVNHWMRAGRSKVLVRTLDGDARAFLSNAYRPLDNVDLAEAVMPLIAERRWDVKSCELTERRLYLKIINPEMQLTVPRGPGK